MRDVLQGLTGNLRAMEVQPLQIMPVRKIAQPAIGDVLGVIKIERADVPKSLQMLQTDVGNLRMREIQILETRDLPKPLKVDIRDPGRAEIDRDNLPCAIGRELPAL